MHDSKTPFPPLESAPARLTSIDVYRGFVMFLLLAEALQFARIAEAFPTSRFWHFLAYHQEHVDWVGCTLHDLIQPSFSFLVGVALPFSVAARLARGNSRAQLIGHALWRSVLLIFIGIALRSAGSSQTYWTFEDTLTQIGLGYPFLFLLGLCPPKWAWSAVGLVLLGYWAAWALYPLPPAGFDFTQVGVPTDWPHHATGFAAHWNKNANFGNAFDQWFLNLFPRLKPFTANSGGYLTLSFIPTLGTMILGLIAGRYLKTDTSGAHAVKRLLLAGLGCMLLGLLAHVTGLCPIVKRIWTPSWTLFSGGWCFFLLAGFYSVIDLVGRKRWAFPLQVIGMNSIAAYFMSWVFHEPLVKQIQIHFGTRPFAIFGDAFIPLLLGIAVVAIEWLILFWMYRRKLFLKI